jgi:predicted metal-binding membrane protein
VAALPRRDLAVILSCIVVVTALAWVYLVHLDRQMSSSASDAKMMAEMGMAMNGPWTPADAWLTFAMWTVMMVGMMAGSVAPMLVLFARAQAGRGQRVSLAVLMFGLGYLAVWTGFSALATLAQWALHQAALLSPAMSVASPRLAGVVLLAAGAYQLTPWKGKCLSHCQTPLGFFMTNWRDGKAGAFQMGMRHGTFCLGCCWALMCVLFAVGVMNLVWVAALTSFVLLEKIGPTGVAVARVAGLAMAALGILRFAAIV